MSIDDQIALCEEVARRQNFHVVQRFVDPELHGTAMGHRPGVQALIAAVRARQLDVVIIEDIDRLGRSQGDTSTTFELLEYRDVELWTQHGRADAAYVTMRGYLAAEENKKKAQQVRRGQEGVHRRGGHTSAPPYGYMLTYTGTPPKSTRVIDPVTSQVVQRAWAEYADGRGTSAIAQDFNRDGIRSASGRPWTAAMLIGAYDRGSGVLRNQLYEGVSRYGVTKQKKNPETGKREWVLQPESDVKVVQVPHLRIVDEITAAKVKTRLEENRHSKPASCRSGRHLFSGLTACADCGHSYVVCERDLMVCSGYRDMRVCENRRRVRRGDVEAAVLDSLADKLKEPNFTKAFCEPYIASRNAAHLGATETLTNLRNQQAADSARIERLASAIENGTSSEQVIGTLTARLDKLLTDQKLRSARISAVSASPPKPLQLGDLHARLTAQLENLRTDLARGTAEADRARTLIRALVSKITIMPLDVPQKPGCRAARLTVSGPINRLLGLLGEEYGVSLHEGTLMQRYPVITDWSISVDCASDLLESKPRVLTGQQVEVLRIAARNPDGATVPEIASHMTTGATSVKHAIGALKRRALVAAADPARSYRQRYVVSDAGQLYLAAT